MTGWSLWIPDVWVKRILPLARYQTAYRHGLLGGIQVHLAWYVQVWLPMLCHEPPSEPETVKAPISWFGCWSTLGEICPDPEWPAWIYLSIDEDNLVARWFGPLPQESGDSWNLSPKWVKINVHTLSS